MSTPSQRVRNLRLERRWTQTQLARRAGVSRETIVRAEGGRSIAPLSQQALAETFGLERDDLFPESEVVA